MWSEVAYAMKSKSLDFGVQGVAESVVFLLVEEVAVADILVRVVTGKRLW